MSKVKNGLMTNKTGLSIAEKLREQNVLLSVIANAGINEEMTVDEIFKIVKAGKASSVFSIGDQIVLSWTDIATGVVYQVPHDVVSFPTVTLQDGETLPAMFIQWHYCIPFGIQYDNYEAIKKAPEGGYPAGTYHFNIATTWSKAIAGDYQFTLTKDVPENGLICGLERCADTDPSTWKIYTYTSGKDTNYIEVVSVTSGNDGTDLGTVTSAGGEDINSIQRFGYGYNRWSQSAIRHWLNSEAGVDAWWTPQNIFDRRPNQLATKAGFLTGYDSDFTRRLVAIKISTALNTVTDSGELEDTYDKVFLPSLSQMHITSQKEGEGDAFEYWKRLSQSSTPVAFYKTYPQFRTFDVTNHTSPQCVWLRSALRSYASHAWYVDSSGYVNAYYGYGAYYAFRCAPVLCLC